MFEILTEMKIEFVVLWVVTSCSVVPASIFRAEVYFNTEDEGNTALQNDGMQPSH
jgi:hypothetical protein